MIDREPSLEEELKEMLDLNGAYSMPSFSKVFILIFSLVVSVEVYKLIGIASREKSITRKTPK